MVWSSCGAFACTRCLIPRPFMPPGRRRGAPGPGTVLRVLAVPIVGPALSVLQALSWGDLRGSPRRLVSAWELAPGKALRPPGPGRAVPGLNDRKPRHGRCILPAAGGSEWLGSRGWNLQGTALGSRATAFVEIWEGLGLEGREGAADGGTLPRILGCGGESGDTGTPTQDCRHRACVAGLPDRNGLCEVRLLVCLCR